ncbi:hypothetical protein ABZ682_40900 [Streptomyces griseoviridis]|uniref:hypothetical protein n=1 Tax=Streptomyces TaxID=1883 RepID=UPI002476D228|nr:hypothetical protein [Streptomyces sp. MAA16]MDH6703014.1 hypothetical protein [Streptomyces sp. MAA16]
MVSLFHDAAAGALSPALLDLPWWAITLCALVLLAEPVRRALRDRAQRRLDAFMMKKVDELPDPERKVQALIDYRRADTGQDPSSPSAAPADRA